MSAARMRSPIRALLAAFAAAIVTSVGGRAEAQVLPSLDARTWRAPTDPNAGMVLEPAVTPGPGVLSFGGFASYAYRPITLRKAGTDDVALRPVEHVLGLDAVANLGIGQRFAIGANLPLVLYQDGSNLLPESVGQLRQVPSSAIGDLALTMKGALLRNEGGGLGVAALGNFTLPSGDRSSFAGEGAVTASARVLVEYTLLVAVAQASVGYKLRTDQRTWPSEDAGGYRFGDEIPWSRRPRAQARASSASTPATASAGSSRRTAGSLPGRSARSARDRRVARRSRPCCSASAIASSSVTTATRSSSSAPRSG